MMNYLINYRSRYGLNERVRIAVVAFFFVIIFAKAVTAERLVSRIELHPIQTMTLTSAQFLNGDKQGPPATIAGELRIPLGGRSYSGSCTRSWSWGNYRKYRSLGSRAERDWDRCVHTRLLYRQGRW